MLKKLFKYDMRYMARILPFVYIGQIVLSVLSALIILFINFVIPVNDPMLVPLLFLASFVILFPSILICTLGSYGTTAVFMVRVYNNMFGREGYLTFTLPVAVKDIVKSKVLTGAIWHMLGALVSSVSAAVPFFTFFISFGARMGQLTGTDVLAELFQILEMMKTLMMNDGYAAASFIMQLVFSLAIFVIAPFVTSAITVMAFSLGNTVKKFRAVLSVGVVFASQWLFQTIASGIGFVTELVAALFAVTPFGMLMGIGAIYVIMIVLYIAAFIASYIIACRTSQNKLNLV